MRRVVLAAAIPIVLSCAASQVPGRYAGEGIEGIDPSRDRYLSENFLDLPAARGHALEAGVGTYSIGSPVKTPVDAYLRVVEWPLCASARLKITEKGRREACHVMVAPSGRLRIDLGDFVPDFAAGLVSSGRKFSYPFSSRYPFYRNRGIRGWTGLYGCFIRGASLSATAGPCLLSVLAGRPASHEAEGTEYLDGDPVSGLRIETRMGRLKTGFVTINRGSRHRERISGCDLAISSRGRTLIMEAAVTGENVISAVWGLAAGKGSSGWGLIGWSVPAGSDGFLASFPGLTTAAGRCRRGLAASVRAILPGRAHLGIWGEVRGSSDGEERTRDSSLRCEIGFKRRRWGLRCSWFSRADESETLVPYPPGPPPEIRATHRIVVSASSRPWKDGSVNVEMRHPYGDGGEGTLISIRGRTRIPWMRLKLSASATRYDSHAGRVGFSFYEPSVSGMIPWRTVYGSGRRMALLIDSGGGRMGFSVRFLWEQGSRVEGSVRIVIAI